MNLEPWKNALNETLDRRAIEWGLDSRKEVIAMLVMGPALQYVTSRLYERWGAPKWAAKAAAHINGRFFMLELRMRGLTRLQAEQNIVQMGRGELSDLLLEELHHRMAHRREGEEMCSAAKFRGDAQVVCSLPADHEGDHLGMYRGVRVRWERETGKPLCESSVEHEGRTYDCERPQGHPGTHHATIDWGMPLTWRDDQAMQQRCEFEENGIRCVRPKGHEGPHDTVKMETVEMEKTA